MFNNFDGEVLDSFTEVSEDDIRKIIHSSPTNSCALDPIPTWLLKKCEDELIPVLSLIVNTSLSCAEFPKELKRAFLTPLIKKIILDVEILKNYRPISNLSFLSKLIERIVRVQLVNHLDKNGLYEVFQSAYRQLHSTETALLRVQNDILQAVDSRGSAILVLLDLSAAFDTIDHETLIRTLDAYCGIKGDSLKCFFIISERPCSICTNRIYFLSRTKSVVWCSSRLSPETSAFHNLHNPPLIELSRGMG